MGVDHLNSGALDRFARRQSRTERSNALVSAAIGQGGVRVHSGGKITVSNGGLDITGSSAISGSQTISGTEVISGTETINGALVVNGTADVYGVLNITSGGGLFVSGGATILNGLGLFGLPTTTNPANVRRTSLGVIQEVTSAARFKIDPQPMALDPRLLDVPVESWIDQHDAEVIAALHDAPRPFTADQQAAYDGATFRRVPGVIAEKVAAAGGAEFVGYDADGKILSVYYERLANARTQILAEKLTAAIERIEALEAIIATR